MSGDDDPEVNWKWVHQPFQISLRLLWTAITKEDRRHRMESQEVMKSYLQQSLSVVKSKVIKSKYHQVW